MDDETRNQINDKFHSLEGKIDSLHQLIGMQSIHINVLNAALAEMLGTGSVDFETLRQRLGDAHAKEQDGFPAEKRRRMAEGLVDSLKNLQDLDQSS